MNVRQPELCTAIDAGENLYVILENRYGRPYVESYELTNVFMKGDRFWGKFRSVHASVGHLDIEQGQRLSYAYNNYCDLVCLSGFDQQVVRYYSAEAYTRMDFKTQGSSQCIWRSGESDLNGLFSCVNNAQQLKIRIESLDGYVYVMPLHTVEVYKDLSGFVAYTEYDGYPEYIRHFDEHHELEEKFKSVRESKPGEFYANTSFLNNMEFFTTHFVITAEYLKHRYLKDGDWVNVDISARSVSIFASN